MTLQPVRRVAKDETNKHLAAVDMTLNSWNRVTDISPSPNERFVLKKYMPPKAIELFTFSQHILGWVPKGQWKLLQLDDSSYFNPAQRYLFQRMLSDQQENPRGKSFLFEYDTNAVDNDNADLLLSYLVNFVLLFEGHGYLVSSNSRDGERLALQDGFVYFEARKEDAIDRARDILKVYESNPSLSPQWIVDITALRQG
jgi:hypothetical protein